MCEVYEHRTITGDTLDGGSITLTVWLRTQYDERLHIWGLELSNGQERANWKHPRSITKQMVQAIKDLAKENPCILKQMFFISDDPRRINLNARLFKQAGYKIEEKYDGIFQVLEILHP